MDFFRRRRERGHRREGPARQPPAAKQSDRHRGAAINQDDLRDVLARVVVNRRLMVTHHLVTHLHDQIKIHSHPDGQQRGGKNRRIPKREAGADGHAASFNT